MSLGLLVPLVPLERLECLVLLELSRLVGVADITGAPDVCRSAWGC